MAALRLVQFDPATGRVLNVPGYADAPAESTDAILARLKGYFTHTPARVGGPSLLAIIGAGLRDQFAEWGRRSAERDELRRSSDRELLDMGLTRDEALTEANKPFWRV